MRMQRRLVACALAVALVASLFAGYGALHPNSGSLVLHPETGTMTRGHPGAPAPAGHVVHAMAAPILLAAVQPALAAGIVEILPNGSVSNASVPIHVSGSVYSLTASLYEPILDERNGSVLEGAGFSVVGHSGVPWSVAVLDANNVVVQDLIGSNA